MSVLSIIYFMSCYKNPLVTWFDHLQNYALLSMETVTAEITATTRYNYPVWMCGGTLRDSKTTEASLLWGPAPGGAGGNPWARTGRLGPEITVWVGLWWTRSCGGGGRIQRGDKPFNDSPSPSPGHLYINENSYLHFSLKNIYILISYLTNLYY